MSFASCKDRKAAAALKAICTAVDAEAAEPAPAEFEESDLARRHPAIAPGWRRAWNEGIPFLDHPPEVRRLICTTNAIEALSSKSAARSHPRALPERRGRRENDLPGAQCRIDRVEAFGPRMARRQIAARDHVRRPLPDGVGNA